MQRAVKDSTTLAELGRRGYLYSEDGKIISKEKHVATIINCYESLIQPMMEATE